MSFTNQSKNSRISHSVDYANGTYIFRIETNLLNMLDLEMKDSLTEVLKEQEFKDKIYQEIEAYLAKADAKEVLTRMIAEVVSETIKTTILELKQQGVI